MSSSLSHLCLFDSQEYALYFSNCRCVGFPPLPELFFSFASSALPHVALKYA